MGIAKPVMDFNQITLRKYFLITTAYCRATVRLNIEWFVKEQINFNVIYLVYTCIFSVLFIVKNLESVWKTLDLG
jgi:hypothetical protein